MVSERESDPDLQQMIELNEKGIIRRERRERMRRKGKKEGKKKSQYTTYLDFPTMESPKRMTFK
jgi:hypothetical protein